MRTELRTELQRLFQLCERHGTPLTRLPGAGEDEIAATERATGIAFTEDLRDLYRFSNGGAYPQTWFAVVTDQLEPFRFCPLREVCEVHGWTTEPMCDDEWNNGGEPRDPRIQALDHHTKWLPVADFSNGNAVIFFDADPTPAGRYGQIITYQHDPDAIRWCATDLVDLLRKSNDLLEENGATLLVE